MRLGPAQLVFTGRAEGDLGSHGVQKPAAVGTVVRSMCQTWFGRLAVTRFAYDPLHPGDLLTVTNPLTKSWTLSYDSYGYVLTSTNPLASRAATGAKSVS